MIVSVLANQIRIGMIRSWFKILNEKERGLVWTYTVFGEKMKQKCLRVMMLPSAKIPAGLIK